MANGNQYSLGTILDRSLRYYADNTAIVDASTQKSYSYADLAQDSDALAVHLESLGVVAGDRIAVLAANCYEYIALFFATWKMGAILVPLNTRLSAGELQGVLEDCSPACLFADRDHEEIVEQLAAKAHALQVPEAQGQYKASDHNQDIVMILYTSGSTGKPKGVMFSREMIHWNGINTGLRLNLTPNDVTVNFLPLFHTGGWHVLLTPLLQHGAKVVICSKFEPKSILQLIEEHRASILMGVPTTMAMLANDQAFASCDVTSLRYALVGGAPMPVKEINMWHDKAVAIRQGYGLTEFGPNVFSLSEHDSQRKIGSIGTPNYYIDTKIVDGELWLKGPMAFSGYYNNPVETAKTITSDGWVKTGDVVSVDDEGYYYVVGRKKNMYISGGENVYPSEVEAVLESHPNVLESCVIGVPDQRWGEVGYAFVAVKDSQSEEALERELAQIFKLKLARYKHPVTLDVVDELPKVASGKINRLQLKEQALGTTV